MNVGSVEAEEPFVKPPNTTDWNCFERTARGNLPDSVKAADDARKQWEEDRKNAGRAAQRKGKGKKADPSLVGLAGLSSDAAVEAFASANPFFIRQAHISKLP